MLSNLNQNIFLLIYFETVELLSSDELALKEPFDEEMRTISSNWRWCLCDRKEKVADIRRGLVGRAQDRETFFAVTFLSCFIAAAFY